MSFTLCLFPSCDAIRLGLGNDVEGFVDSGCLYMLISSWFRHERLQYVLHDLSTVGGKRTGGAERETEGNFVYFVAGGRETHVAWHCCHYRVQVIPPKGYCPRRGGYDLTKVEIGTPIRQHTFGTGGAYSAILEEHPSMTAEEFSKLATSPDRQPPRKGHREDDMLERSFWSSVTVRK